MKNVEKNVKKIYNFFFLKKSEKIEKKSKKIIRNNQKNNQ